jgi:hypothetical protein
MGGLLPTLPIVNTSTVVTEESVSTSTFGIDFINNRISSMIDGEQAMVQAIGIMLNVARYQWLIYSPNFGSELSSVLGNGSLVVEALLPNLIQEALSVDDRVLGVSNYTFAVNGDSILVTFTVSTIYGNINQSVQVNQ